jgi:hypothetical protein
MAACLALMSAVAVRAVVPFGKHEARALRSSAVPPGYCFSGVALLNMAFVSFLRPSRKRAQLLPKVSLLITL